MRMVAFLGIMLLGLLASGQLYWSQPITVANGLTYGDVRGRIVHTEDGVAVLWSKNGGNVFVATKDYGSTQFDTPVQLNPAGVTVTVFNYGGSDIAAKGNTCYAVYMTEPYLQADLYILSSTDGGKTWSNPDQIDLPDSITPFLPTVAIDDGGNPKVLFMAYDDQYLNPQYAVVSSADSGQTFGSVVVATDLAPHEVCDCCPGNLTIKGDTVAVQFRNNDQNLRDMWASISFDGGQTFTSVQDIDPGNWIINQCPSSGPNAFMSNSKMRTVWMSQATGNPQIYWSEMDLPNQTFQSGLLDPNPANYQNYPRISGSGDTIGIVYRNSGGGVSNTLFHYSFSGRQGLSNAIDVARDSSKIQFDGDITYVNGQFHIIYRELQSRSIMYRIASAVPIGIDGAESASGPRFYPNPTTGIINVSGLTESAELAVYDLQGRLLHLQNLAPVSERLSLSNLPDGVYLLQLFDDTGQRVYRVVKR